jgi:hypothetical protein
MLDENLTLLGTNLEANNSDNNAKMRDLFEYSKRMRGT